jgi:predicted DNA-binding protein (MmcQ/YjbR family)
MSYDKLRSKINQLPNVSTRSMFGYECFSVDGKFFVGLSTKKDYQVIIRLPKNEQQNAVKNKGIKPFSHGGRAGWIEINTKLVTIDAAFRWVKKGYANALNLAKKSKK